MGDKLKYLSKFIKEKINPKRATVLFVVLRRDVRNLLENIKYFDLRAEIQTPQKNESQSDDRLCFALAEEYLNLGFDVNLISNDKWRRIGPTTFIVANYRIYMNGKVQKYDKELVYLYNSSTKLAVEKAIKQHILKARLKTFSPMILPKQKQYFGNGRNNNQEIMFEALDSVWSEENYSAGTSPSLAIEIARKAEKGFWEEAFDESFN